MFEWLKKSKAPEAQAQPVSKDLPPNEEGLSKLFSAMAQGRVAPKRGTAELIRAYTQIPILRIIVQRISESVAAVPFNIQVRKASNGKVRRDKHYERLPQEHKDKLAPRYKNEQTLDVYWEDPVLDFLSEGNGLLSGFDIRQLMQTYFELSGTAIAWITRTVMGVPESLWPIPPHWISSFPTCKGEPYVIRISGRDLTIPYDDIFILRDPNPETPYLMGSGVGTTLGDELDIDVYIAAFVKAFFLNYANPDVIIAFEDLHIDDLKRLEADWQNRYRGAARTHATHFISPKPEVSTLTPTFADMTLIDLRSFIRDIVRETWGVPPEIIGIIENSNRATIDSASYIFAQWVLLPRLERWRMALQDQVVSQIDKRKVIGYLNPIPKDKAFILQAAQASPYTLTINEWRAIQHQPPRPDGDVYLQPPQAMSPIFSQGRSAEASKAASSLVQKDLLSKLDKLMNTIDPAELEKELAYWENLVDDVGESIIEDLPTERSFDPTDQAIQKHTEDFLGKKIKGINDETRRLVKDILLNGMAEGLSMRDMADNIKEFFDAADSRAMVVARTEVNRTGNFAKIEAYEQSGVVEQKQWLAMLDGKTRSDHAAMSGGDPIPLRAEFVLPDGSTTLYPGNTGVAAQDISCRCTTVPVTIVGIEYDFDTQVTKATEDKEAYMKRILEWEEKVTRSIMKAFKSQEKTLLEAFENYQLL